MLRFPQIDLVAVQLGPLAVHWYGVTYLVAFGLWFLLATRRLRHAPYAALAGPAAWSRKDLEDMLFLGIAGTIIGGRLGYVLFYKPGFYFANPRQAFAIWQGGMSFHGGLLGVLLSQLWFARTRQKPFWQVIDFVAPCVPLGLAAGRIGNFINGELWGRPASADLPWAIARMATSNSPTCGRANSSRPGPRDCRLFLLNGPSPTAPIAGGAAYGQSAVALVAKRSAASFSR